MTLGAGSYLVNGSMTIKSGSSLIAANASSLTVGGPPLSFFHGLFPICDVFIRFVGDLILEPSSNLEISSELELHVGGCVHADGNLTVVIDPTVIPRNVPQSVAAMKYLCDDGGRFENVMLLSSRGGECVELKDVCSLNSIFPVLSRCFFVDAIFFVIKVGHDYKQTVLYLTFSTVARTGCDYEISPAAILGSSSLLSLLSWLSALLFISV